MHWYAGWDFGWIWGMHLLWWLVWVVLAIGIWRAVTHSSAGSNSTVLEPPLEVLRRRYAEGALTTEEFEERRKVLAIQKGATP